MFLIADLLFYGIKFRFYYRFAVDCPQYPFLQTGSKTILLRTIDLKKRILLTFDIESLVKEAAFPRLIDYRGEKLINEVSGRR